MFLGRSLGLFVCCCFWLLLLFFGRAIVEGDACCSVLNAQRCKLQVSSTVRLVRQGDILGSSLCMQPFLGALLARSLVPLPLKPAGRS